MKILVLAITLVLGSCVSGPKLDSKLSYLNGNNYEKKASVLFVPVLKTKSEDKKTRKPKR